jgi:hypothetical protein
MEKETVRTVFICKNKQPDWMSVPDWAACHEKIASLHLEGEGECETVGYLVGFSS